MNHLKTETLSVPVSNGQGNMKLSLLSVAGWEEILSKGSEMNTVEAYAKQAWYRRGLEIRAAALTDVPITVSNEQGPVFSTQRGQEQEADGDLTYINDLLELLYQTGLALPSESNAYWLKQGTAGEATGRRKIARLQWMIPSTVTAQYDETTGQLTGYKRKVPKGTQPLKMEDVVHLKSLSPYSERDGVHGEGGAALMNARVLWNLDRWLSGELESGVLGKWAYVSKTKPNPQNWKDLLLNWKSKVAGPDNAGEPIALPGTEGSLTRLTAKLNEVYDNDLSEDQRRSIAAALGIPYTLFTSESASFATAQVDLLMLYAFTVRPQGRILERQINRGLFAPLGLTFRFHWEALEVFQRAEVDKATAAAQYIAGLLALLDEGIISPEEARLIAEQFLDIPVLESTGDGQAKGLPGIVASLGEDQPLTMQEIMAPFTEALGK